MFFVLENALLLSFGWSGCTCSQSAANESVSTSKDVQLQYAVQVLECPLNKKKKLKRLAQYRTMDTVKCKVSTYLIYTFYSFSMEMTSGLRLPCTIVLPCLASLQMKDAMHESTLCDY